MYKLEKSAKLNADGIEISTIACPPGGPRSDCHTDLPGMHIFSSVFFVLFAGLYKQFRRKAAFVYSPNYQFFNVGTGLGGVFIIIINNTVVHF